MADNGVLKEEPVYTPRPARGRRNSGVPTQILDVAGTTSDANLDRFGRRERLGLSRLSTAVTSEELDVAPQWSSAHQRPQLLITTSPIQPTYISGSSLISPDTPVLEGPPEPGSPTRAILGILPTNLGNPRLTIYDTSHQGFRTSKWLALVPPASFEESEPAQKLLASRRAWNNKRARELHDEFVPIMDPALRASPRSRFNTSRLYKAVERVSVREGSQINVGQIFHALKLSLPNFRKFTQTKALLRQTQLQLQRMREINEDYESQNKKAQAYASNLEKSLKGEPGSENAVSILRCMLEDERTVSNNLKHNFSKKNEAFMNQVRHWRSKAKTLEQRCSTLEAELNTEPHETLSEDLAKRTAKSEVVQSPAAYRRSSTHSLEETMRKQREQLQELAKIANSGPTEIKVSSPKSKEEDLCKAITNLEAENDSLRRSLGVSITESETLQGLRKELVECNSDRQALLKVLRDAEQDEKALKETIETITLEYEILESKSKLDKGKEKERVPMEILDLERKLAKCQKHGRELGENLYELQGIISQQADQADRQNLARDELKRQNSELWQRLSKDTIDAQKRETELTKDIRQLTDHNERQLANSGKQKMEITKLNLLIFGQTFKPMVPTINAKTQNVDLRTNRQTQTASQAVEANVATQTDLPSTSQEQPNLLCEHECDRLYEEIGRLRDAQKNRREAFNDYREATQAQLLRGEAALQKLKTISENYDKLHDAAMEILDRLDAREEELDERTDQLEEYQDQLANCQNQLTRCMEHKTKRGKKVPKRVRKSPYKDEFKKMEASPSNDKVDNSHSIKLSPTFVLPSDQSGHSRERFHLGTPRTLQISTDSYPSNPTKHSPNRSYPFHPFTKNPSPSPKEARAYSFDSEHLNLPKLRRPLDTPSPTRFSHHSSPKADRPLNYFPSLPPYPDSPPSTHPYPLSPPLPPRRILRIANQTPSPPEPTRHASSATSSSPSNTNSSSTSYQSVPIIGSRIPWRRTPIHNPNSRTSSYPPFIHSSPNTNPYDYDFSSPSSSLRHALSLEAFLAAQWDVARWNWYVLAEQQTAPYQALIGKYLDGDTQAGYDLFPEFHACEGSYDFRADRSRLFSLRLAMRSSGAKTWGLEDGRGGLEVHLGGSASTEGSETAMPGVGGQGDGGEEGREDKVVVKRLTTWGWGDSRFGFWDRNRSMGAGVVFHGFSWSRRASL